MSDELQDAEHRATRLADEVETLRGENDMLAVTETALRAVRTVLEYQRDQLLIPAREITAVFPALIPAHCVFDLGAAIKACEPSSESVAGLRTAAEYAIARLDDRLERAHDSSGYDEAVAIRDAAQSLSSGCAVTVMEADALIAELDAIAATGGPLDDTDDPAYNPEAREVAPC